MTATLDYYRTKKITPRLIEIMNRMVLGEAPKKIREEFGLSTSRFSVIINSPLFKLELKKKLLRREELMLDIQGNILEGAKLGTKLYRDILDSPDGYTTETKLKAANAAAGFAVKLMDGGGNGGGENGGNGSEGEGKSYEERLREVTLKETIRTVTHTPEVDTSPPNENDLLLGFTEEEDITPKSDQSESIIDTD